jgi:hypothetical protein
VDDMGRLLCLEQRGGAVMCWRISAQAWKAVDVLGIGNCCMTSENFVLGSEGRNWRAGMEEPFPSVRAGGIVGRLWIHSWEGGRMRTVGMRSVLELSGTEYATFGSIFEIGGRLVLQRPPSSSGV